ncbi:DUF805 domain-containing protein [Photobacterium sanguinicancri]|uniref:DUF805 domain-containing protein n=1 Tax=Photobacterium sanguinicancri TaxID=875932 RepID=A0ABX4FXT6_9GAMM|nr:DUF805 domain-containing protein [Photobacterium sanguinicancri]OZS43707.1 hypothetical protein ASV53_11750 [Photobacterium sanguinicancri]OZS45910.1 hypothetical protein ASV53_00815 [Photobacterium sanguinicancri]
MSWYLHVLKNYAVFKGRARRKEYWYFFLVNLVIALCLAVVDNLLHTPGSADGAGILGSIYSFAVMIPTIAVGVRRLHDTGRVGWWMFIVIIPVIGALVLLYFFVKDSEAQSNEYGPNPKQIEDAQFSG